MFTVLRSRFRSYSCSLDRFLNRSNHLFSSCVLMVLCKKIFIDVIVEMKKKKFFEQYISQFDNCIFRLVVRVSNKDYEFLQMFGL